MWSRECQQNDESLGHFVSSPLTLCCGGALYKPGHHSESPDYWGAGLISGVILYYEGIFPPEWPEYRGGLNTGVATSRGIWF